MSHPGPPPHEPGANLTLILLLVLGLPLLLGGAAYTLSIVLDEPRVGQAVANGSPSSSPSLSGLYARTPYAGSPAPGQPVDAVALGETLTLEGDSASVRVSVTAGRLLSSVTPTDPLLRPAAGNRHVAVELSVSNAGTSAYTGFPISSAGLTDQDGRQYRPVAGTVQEGTTFVGPLTVAPGGRSTGLIVFELPAAAQPASFQFAASPSGGQKGSWSLS
ncbi:DUF4352 domain-containing protein [Nonomuraea sp. NPDC050328]|uniref:DUF4352 domain-containing protein n=1 Tax=Nonomuraea sp. NPDC050328 TaxID=3364361 RepID=UPI0037A73A2A